jgi:hypothetical protein
LTEIGALAFKRLHGDVIIESKCPSLKRIGAEAFHYMPLSTQSRLDLSELQSLVAIGQWTFRRYGGELALTGRGPMLTEIGFQAFTFARNPKNNINLECVSPNGLTWVEREIDRDENEDLPEEVQSLEQLTLEEAAFYEYLGQQNLLAPPPGCIECWMDSYTPASKKCTFTTTTATNTAEPVYTCAAPFGNVTLTNTTTEKIYTCDAALGDVPLTKALYLSVQAGGRLAEEFAAVTCIPTEAFVDHDAPLLLNVKMPNLISIGDRSFFRFNGGDFTFEALDESYLPKLEHIGVEAFAQFVQPADDRSKISIRLDGMPALISIGTGAFNAPKAPFMLLQIDCACPNLEQIGDTAFSKIEYGIGSKITFTEL